MAGRVPIQPTMTATAPAQLSELDLAHLRSMLLRERDALVAACDPARAVQEAPWARRTAEEDERATRPPP
jgi:hypothetical protein